MKVESFVRSFQGEGLDDRESYWQKFKVLAKMQGWDTVEEHTRPFPLSLEPDVLLVFMKMLSKYKKNSEDKVKKKMRS